MNNLLNQYAPKVDGEKLTKDFAEYFADSDRWLTEFTKTREFEKQLRLELSSKYCHAMNNGTMSLAIALLAAGVKSGDEVLVPALTMIATYNAVLLIGANPILVDIDDRTLCMDLIDAADKSTRNTKAMIYVTLNGRSGNPFDVKSFCELHDLVYIEDDAQAMFSKYSNESFIGSAADIASYSFSPQKIITTGQGGCLMTNKSHYSKAITKLRDFGRTYGGVDIHETFGINSKFTDLQAIVGLNQLEDIEHRITIKKLIYHGYRARLKGVVEFLKTDLSVTVPWFVDVYVERRDELNAFLFSKGIGTRPMYPPIHTQKFVEDGGRYPVAEWFSKRGLWLPCSLGITTDEIKFVCEKIKDFYS